MDKIIDILEELDKDIDLTDPDKKIVKLDELSDKSTLDLSDNFDDLNISWNDKIKIRKNTKNWLDNISSPKKQKDIDLTKKTLLENKDKILKEIKLKEDFFWKISIKKTKIKKRNFNNNLNEKIKKTLLILLFIFILWFADKILIENFVRLWYENLIEIKEDYWNLDYVYKKADKSKAYFQTADILFLPFSYIPNQNISNVNNIISWWINTSNFILKWVNEYKDGKDYLKQNWWLEQMSFTDYLVENRKDFIEMYRYLYNSLSNYLNLWDLWDENLNNKLWFVVEKLFILVKKLEIVEQNFDIWLSILWENSTKKYLILFQNNDEIRSTWGFIGSTAMVTIRNGQILDIENKDIYAYEWLVNKVLPANKKEKAPKWLNQITPTFGLRDSNYFVKYSDSSNSIKWFLDKIDVNIDWIVYLNQNIVLDLLDSIWWVDSEILWEKITSENFSLIISSLVEAKVFKVWTLWTPKQVLFDFWNELLSKLIKTGDYYNYFDILIENIASKDIVFYSFTPEENSLLWKIGINWYMNFWENLDFNYPVYTSIWWNKTDRFIDYRYDKTIKTKTNSCDYTTNLLIYNTHLFSKYELEKVDNLLDKYWVKDKTDILNIQWRGDNKSYLRVVLPLKAEVKLKKGQVLQKYDKYQIVELFTNTRRLETTKYEIEYDLKNPDCKDYDFKFFKQAWIKDYNLNIFYSWNEMKNTNIESDFIFDI